MSADAVVGLEFRQKAGVRFCCSNEKRSRAQIKIPAGVSLAGID
jgi:hypothetical protein